MGKLSSDTIAAIDAGAPARQYWNIYVPAAAGSATLASVKISDDLAGPYRVVDAGKYEVEGYNVSMAVPGKLTSGLYSFTVRNDDNLFDVATSGNFWYNGTASYQADPVECYVDHVLMVLVDGTWTQVLSYYGKVVDVEYDDSRHTATIMSVALAASMLEQRWSESDAEEQDSGMDLVL